MKIITLTLNPAFDVHCAAPAFSPYRESIATVTSRDAGGKGVNISRALTANGVENTALVVLGDENGAEFLRALTAEGLNVRTLTVAGRIRENFTLHTEGKPETRISFSGFSADVSLLDRVEEMLMPLLDAESTVTLTGSLPEGIPMDAVKAFHSRLRERGVQIVIDSKSFSLSDLCECRPWLIKPNGEEIEEYLGRRIDSLAAAADAARELQRRGIGNVMITLGGDGAVLATDGGVYAASAPHLTVRSTVGAGDSAIGGFLAATAEGLFGAEALSCAVAFGSAACLTEGTQAPRREAIDALLTKISCRCILP